ncbi:unnamed protein product [Danaus chrysippus]|uniref:(African queen) hypothetical protein n=1 Tax=Danaus chrysippus TaxID=151541 RepID=A0A8J2VZT5_9NEOP|nr:unnamed protein product [Danaus chrysippus]
MIHVRASFVVTRRRCNTSITRAKPTDCVNARHSLAAPLASSAGGGGRRREDGGRGGTTGDTEYGERGGDRGDRQAGGRGRGSPHAHTYTPSHTSHY